MLAVPCQTEKRLPECVLSGTFDYGFKLGLMAKDVRPTTKRGPFVIIYLYKRDRPSLPFNPVRDRPPCLPPF